MSANTTYYLSALDTSIASASATLPVAVNTTALTGDAVVEQNVSLSALRDLFVYHTDSTDVTNDVPSDILFQMNAQNVTTNIIGTDLRVANVLSGNIESTSADQDVARDYVRYLALKLFGTHLATDIIANETELRNTLQSNFVAEFDYLLGGLESYGPLDASYSTLPPIWNIDYPTITIFNQMIGNNPERFADITQYISTYVDPSGNSYYQMPFQAGDVIAFVLTIRAASGQQSLTGGVVTIPIRTYLIKLIATAT